MQLSTVESTKMYKYQQAKKEQKLFSSKNGKKFYISSQKNVISGHL